ncbi:AraC family transcriptional regulator [Edaphobacter sp. 12200R-103]|jgi:AraC-like DNA-binding protein|uniref:AraC family transcriptional regulator n=1 Tax=Edaphobacter sp. 12200R-103 TaxID=2703788 RepID=UPI00138C6661|nr:AraC family transcriptional regulator [Edaphobacter sp. 12200R-103]QHS53184.1 AraC family transcriptional regulator [Edaphobacter sp. 12200R-103]
MSGEQQEGDASSLPSTAYQVLNALESEIQGDHGERPLGGEEHARIWRHACLDGIELFHGTYKNYEFARHFHRIPAIGVVDRGRMSSYCRGGNHILAAGTVLLLNPGEIHAPAPAGPSGWSFRMFYLDDAFFEKVSLPAAMRPLRFRQPFVQDRELASTLFQLHRELEVNGDRLRFEALFVSIFSRLAERYSEASTLAVDQRLDRTAIGVALDYMEANYDRNLSLDELAGLSSYSASHFLRMFRDVVGLTPHAYLTQFRIELAITLLRSGTPLIDIAGLVGFTDQSHFTRKFKRILGVTPGQYAVSSGTRYAGKVRRLPASGALDGFRRYIPDGRREK